MPREVQSSKNVEYSQLSKEPRRRKSIISLNIEDDNASTSMHIENVEQLKYGIEKNLDELKNAGHNMRIEYKDIVDKMNVKAKDHFITKFQLHDKHSANLTLKIKILKMKKEMQEVIRSVEQEDIADSDNDEPVFHQKNTTSKKFSDSSIIIDVINSDIKEGLSAIKNNLTNNFDGYSTDFQEIIYVRTKIEGKILIHITVRLRKKTKQPFKTIEEIFDVLGLMYGDLNRRINAMKTFKRFRQIDVFKNFIMFGAEFQRLSIDAEMDDTKIFLKDLKDKMSYELQKTMIANIYELIDLYAFAKKCQFMNQTFRDVKNRSKYSRTGNNRTITSNEKVVPANIKTITPTIETSSFRQITSIPTGRPAVAPTTSFKAISQQSFGFTQINVMKCYNCNKLNHISRNCSNFSVVISRNAVMKEIIIEDTENEKSKKE